MPFRKNIYYGYYVLFICFLCQVIVHGLTGYSMSLYVKPLTDQFGWSRTQLMAGSTLMVLFMGLSSPFIGRLVNRMTARRVLALGGFTLGLGLILLGLIQYLWQYYALYATLGMSAAALGVIPTSMVIANWFERRRGFAIGILGSGIGVGGFLLPLLIGGYLIPRFGWRPGYWVPGILAATILIPLTLWIVKSRPQDMGLLPDEGKVANGENGNCHRENVVTTGLELRAALRTPAFWFLSLAFLAFALANMSIFQNQVPHLQDIGFNSTMAASSVSIVGIGSAVGKFSFGWLCDYIPAKFTLVLGSALQIMAIFMLMSLTPGSSYFLIWAYALILGLGIGSWLPALSMTVSTAFGLLAYGTIFGIMNMIFMGGGSIGPVIAGYIYDTQGSYFGAFVLAIGLHCLVVPAMLLVRKPKIAWETSVHARRPGDHNDIPPTEIK